MILRAYTFPCGKATDQNTDVYIEVLKKIMDNDVLHSRSDIK